jgi:hypothetical protein
LRVDGGACVNDLLMQFQADLLGIPVVRPAVIETTALGAAYLAGLTTGVYRNTAELKRIVARRAPLYPHHGARARAGHDGPLGAWRSPRPCSDPQRGRLTGTLGLIGGGNRACVILGAGLKPGESPAAPASR